MHMEMIEVVSPLGEEMTTQKAIAPRVTQLDGKTIGEVWNGVFKGNHTFPAVRESLKRRYPGLRIIPYTEFPTFHGNDTPSNQIKLARQIAALAKEKGCDALISGNGA